MDEEERYFYKLFAKKRYEECQGDGKKYPPKIKQFWWTWGDLIKTLLIFSAIIGAVVYFIIQVVRTFKI